MFKESNLNGFPKALVSFDPYNYNLGELFKRFRTKRSRDRSRERQSGILLIESVIKEKSYKEIVNIK